MTDNRLIEIETKIAYQEDLIQDLNQIVTRQQKQIDQLELTCKALLERIQEVSSANDSPDAKHSDEKPPHY